MRRLPTVNDLRSRECYICRDEETYDKPSNPAKRWVHPCKCTLIAHEDCLLEWIQASENNPDKPISGILKCPQCGVKYTLESNNPLILKIMDICGRVVTKCGVLVTFLTIGTGVASVGTGIYILSAGYGAFAVRQFLGQEMYHLVLGEEVDKWPIYGFLTLPFIPLSLILSHTKRFRDTLPLISLMSMWPSVPPINPDQPRSRFWSFLALGPAMPWKVPRLREPAGINRIASDLLRDLLYGWPPSPFLFSIGLGIVRSSYSRSLERFRRFVLGDMLKVEDNPTAGGFLQEIRVEVRIDDDEEDDENENENVDQQREVQDEPAEVIAENQAEPLRDDNNVRLELDGAGEGGPVAINGAPVEAAPIVVRQLPEAANAERQGVNVAPAANVLAGRARLVNVPANPNRNQGDDRGGNAEARVRLELAGGYLGKVVGGALIIPPLASFAGSLLLRLALPPGPGSHSTLNFAGYSPYSPRRLLCRFLGVRPPGSALPFSMQEMYAFPDDMSAGEIFRSTLMLACRAFVIGSPAWASSDPVWWRNAVGLGIFYFAKDMLSICYQYFSLREIRSRHVQDRAFEGINPDELDLKPELRGTFEQSQETV